MLLYICKRAFHIYPCIYKKIKCYNAKSSAYYFYVKTKILVDFHISITVSLIRPVFIKSEMCRYWDGITILTLTLEYLIVAD